MGLLQNIRNAVTARFNGLNRKAKGRLAVTGVGVAAITGGTVYMLSGYSGDVCCVDIDRDGDVDGVDFSKFSSCYNKANNPPRCNPELAWLFDQDNDGDVDLADFAEFQVCYNKAGRPYRKCRYPMFVDWTITDLDGNPSPYFTLNEKTTRRMCFSYKGTIRKSMKGLVIPDGRGGYTVKFPELNKLEEDNRTLAMSELE